MNTNNNYFKFNSIKFKIIYVLKQRTVGKLKNNTKPLKYKAFKAKHMKISVREYFIAIALVGKGLLIVEGSQSHSDTPLSLGLL
jgi:capsule polysaccharide export protein KpsC/LpsZ